MTQPQKASEPAVEITDQAEVDFQNKKDASSAPIADSFLAKRPRDARLIHTILANYGVNSYQERVPLQLIDLAYRYTASILQDAYTFTNDGFGPGSGSGRNSTDSQTISLAALRLAIHSKTHYQYSGTLSKEVYLELAQEKNRIGLPPISREWGTKLPPEQFLMTGKGWDLSDVALQPNTESDVAMDEDKSDAEGADEELEGGVMEDVFGPSRDA